MPPSALADTLTFVPLWTLIRAFSPAWAFLEFLLCIPRPKP